MIPTIETICEDLKAGKITVGQAIAWLYQHAEGSANELRDHFAAHAMAALMVSPHLELKDGFSTHECIAIGAYEFADAMLKERSSGDGEKA